MTLADHLQKRITEDDRNKATLTGELAGDKVLVFSDGDDYANSELAQIVKLMTPEIQPTEFGFITHVSWAFITQMGSTFKDHPRFKWEVGPELSQWIINQIIQRACEGDLLGEKPVRPPMDHQSAGALAIGMNGNFLLADEPGCGKTQAALMGLAELEARGKTPWPALVVCPAAVIDPWLEDIAQVYPDWAKFSTAYRGPNRKSKLKTRGYKLFVTSYETMRNDIGDASKPGVLLKHGFNSVISDEAHKLCNYDTKQSVRFRRLAKKTRYAIGATGTPTNKGPANFWPILNSLEPHAFPSRDRFKIRYTTDKGQQHYGSDPGLAKLDPLTEVEFRDVMRGTMRRVAKADVLKDLPPKTYQRRLIDIPPRFRKAYDEMEEDMIAHLPDAEEETALTAMSTLAKMMRLAQLANSACDLEEIEELDTKPDSPTFGEYIPKILVHPKEPCWKGDALLEIMEELHQDDPTPGITHGHRPVVAFAPHAKLTRLAGSMAERKGYKVGYIDGNVSSAQRTKYRHAFQNNELDLMAVSTGAGGTGLTLTAASVCVFLMRPWSYIEATQAEDRLHRKQQRGNVQVIDLVTRNSVEERVLEALRVKAGSLSELVQDRRILEEFLGANSA